eukprot:6176225-Pleurochrysis_carterae.AAC.1
MTSLEDEKPDSIGPHCGAGFNPPCARHRERASMRNIHDRVAHSEKHPRWQRLREKVGQVVRAVDKRDGNVLCFHTLAHKEMAAIYMLGT